MSRAILPEPWAKARAELRYPAMSQAIPHLSREPSLFRSSREPSLFVSSREPSHFVWAVSRAIPYLSREPSHSLCEPWANFPSISEPWGEPNSFEPSPESIYMSHEPSLSNPSRELSPHDPGAAPSPFIRAPSVSEPRAAPIPYLSREPCTSSTRAVSHAPLLPAVFPCPVEPCLLS